MKINFIKCLFPILFCFGISTGTSELNREVDLRGSWLFEIGDNRDYADPKFDDSDWEAIHVPGNWENQNFPGYDGYAWYRKHFKISKKLTNATLYLDLGKVDDVDRVFLNGHFLNGSGGLPPTFHSAMDRHRLYIIPNEFINFKGSNCLSVRVYDHDAEGGIREGDIGICSKKQPIPLAYNLSGLWKFMPGDNPDWARLEFEDQTWATIPVPGKWEHFGYKDVDAYAWYRKAFILPKSMTREYWILVLGKIDDVDEIYFNGVRIGQTGEFPDRNRLFIHTQYLKLRFYTIPKSLILPDRKNSIAVRVYDRSGDGGIYEGPIGLISRKVYLKKRHLFD
ncbi:glycoside hydrolase [candidate division KSB1 bacterium]|nr:glycoside hydrolase [candidate division KSB1 bacterium]